MGKANLKQRVAELSLAGRVGLLAVTFLVLWLVAMPVALALGRPSGLMASGLAAAAVGLASIAGLLGGEMFPGPQAAMMRMLFGMMVRMTIPLAACLVVLASGSPLVSGGFVFYVLVFYLAALPVDALLAVAQVVPVVCAADSGETLNR